MATKRHSGKRTNLLIIYKLTFCLLRFKHNINMLHTLLLYTSSRHRHFHILLNIYTGSENLPDLKEGVSCLIWDQTFTNIDVQNVISFQMTVIYSDIEMD